MIVSDNEVDGKTLMKLTEAMIARLLPTSMKQQVEFMELRKLLDASVAPHPVGSALSGSSTGDCPRVEPPVASIEQHG